MKSLKILWRVLVREKLVSGGLCMERVQVRGSTFTPLPTSAVHGGADVPVQSTTMPISHDSYRKTSVHVGLYK